MKLLIVFALLCMVIGSSYQYGHGYGYGLKVCPYGHRDTGKYGGLCPYGYGKAGLRSIRTGPGSRCPYGYIGSGAFGGVCPLGYGTVKKY